MTHPALRAAAGAGLIAAAVLFVHLGSYPLWDPDEGRHAEVAREVLEAPSLTARLVPSWNGAPYHDKPILFYWQAAAAYAVLGVHELSGRLVAASSALVTVLVVAAWGAGCWNVASGFLAGVVLTTALEFVVLGRMVTLDMAFTLWVTLGVLAIHWFSERPEGRSAGLNDRPEGRSAGLNDRPQGRSAGLNDRPQGRSLVPAAIATALGTLTKGFAAPVLVGGIGLGWLALSGRLRLLTPRLLARSALAYLIVTLPWYVAAGIADPAYLREFLLVHHLQRFTGSGREIHAGPALFYLPALAIGFLPWSVLLPAVLRGTLRAGRRSAAELLCVTWAAVVVVFFSLARGKLATYILPAFPPLALLTGRFLGRLLAGNDTDERDLRWTRAGTWVLVAILAVAPVVLVVAAWERYGGALRTTSLLSLLLWPMAAALALALRRGEHGTPVAIVAGGTIVALLLGFRFAVPRLSEVTSSAPVAAAIQEAVPGQANVPVVAYGIRAPSLIYYLRRPVLLLGRPGPLKRLVTEHPLVLVVTSRLHVDDLQRAGVIHLWQEGPRRLLYASQPAPSSLTPGDAARDNNGE